MINYPNRVFRFARQVVAVASLGLLAGCIDSAEPLLGNARPLLGERLNLQLYAMRKNAVYDPATANFVWQNGHYARTGGTDTSLHDFTVHLFRGSDLIAQEIPSGASVNYAILRKLAEGTYLVFVIDEDDANAATRKRFCRSTRVSGCTLTTRQAVLAFARASAAKRPSVGGLVLVLSEQ